MRPSDLRPTITLREPAALITAALSVAVLCVLLGPTPARVIGGFALVFVLPGLALTLAILPMARVDPIAQLLLVVGVSVAVTIVTGLMVRSAYQLTTDAWAISLALVTIAGVVATALEDDSGVVPGPKDGPRTPRRFAFWALLVVAALACVAAVLVGVWGQSESRTPGFTQLWALRASENPSTAVRLGVRSHERRIMSYRIRVTIRGRLVREATIRLEPGQTWQAIQKVGNSSDDVNVGLWRSGRRPVYRRVRVAPL